MTEVLEKKVMNGLKRCSLSDTDDEFEEQCSLCPYYDPETDVDECTSDLCWDAIYVIRYQRKFIEKLKRLVSDVDVEELSDAARKESDIDG